MSQGAAYLVVDPSRGSYGNALALDGPFAYPRWTTDVRMEMALSFAKAHAWAAAFGGVVVPFSAEPWDQARSVRDRQNGVERKDPMFTWGVAG